MLISLETTEPVTTNARKNTLMQIGNVRALGTNLLTQRSQMALVAVQQHGLLEVHDAHSSQPGPLHSGALASGSKTVVGARPPHGPEQGAKPDPDELRDGSRAKGSHGADAGHGDPRLTASTAASLPGAMWSHSFTKRHSSLPVRSPTEL